jgi:hypothetical protein
MERAKPLLTVTTEVPDPIIAKMIHKDSFKQIELVLTQANQVWRCVHFLSGGSHLRAWKCWLDTPEGWDPKAFFQMFEVEGFSSVPVEASEKKASAKSLEPVEEESVEEYERQERETLEAAEPEPPTEETADFVVPPDEAKLTPLDLKIKAILALLDDCEVKGWDRSTCLREASHVQTKSGKPSILDQDWELETVKSEKYLDHIIAQLRSKLLVHSKLLAAEPEPKPKKSRTSKAKSETAASAPTSPPKAAATVQKFQRRPF